MSKRIVFITGASTGIGRALALELARRGATLGLFARSGDKLEALAAECRKSHGATVEYATLDVERYEDVAPTVDGLRDRMGGLDVMIANAGVTGINRTGGGQIDLDAKVIHVNLLGAMATLDAAARHFRAEKRGHLVGVSSIAAFLPISGSGAYSASKAGLTSYLRAARGELGKHGIRVSAVHPGYVKTELVSDMDKFPFVVSAEAAAVELLDALDGGDDELVVPARPWKLLLPALRVLPKSITKRIM